MHLKSYIIEVEDNYSDSRKDGCNLTSSTDGGTAESFDTSTPFGRNQQYRWWNGSFLTYFKHLLQWQNSKIRAQEKNNGKENEDKYLVQNSRK